MKVCPSVRRIFTLQTVSTGQVHVKYEKIFSFLSIGLAEIARNKKRRHLYIICLHIRDTCASSQYIV